MATSTTSKIKHSRKTSASIPKHKSRDHVKRNQPCRYILSGGNCRDEIKGCPFNHDKSSIASDQMESRKHLNVDSPSFTPSLLNSVANGLGSTNSARVTTISPKAANAAIFTPKSIKSFTPTPQIQQGREIHGEWPQSVAFQEFVPQSFDTTHLPDNTAQHAILNSYDPFQSQSSIASIGSLAQTAQINPYVQDTSTVNSAPFFSSSTAFAQPLQHHLYAPSGPLRENLFEYQRTTHDFFIPEDLREELSKKAETTRQVLPQSNLPNVDTYHSLVPLDTNHQRNATLFGYPTWVYKAISNIDGHSYALRRLEGYKLTSEQHVRSIQAWKRVRCANVVSVHTAFTSQAFGDSSLIFVTDYHPLSKTVAEQFFNNRFQSNRGIAQAIPEQELWGYVVQIAAAIKAIHSNGLAAQTIHPSKILVTSKGHLRLNGCGILDVVRFEAHRSVSDLQQEDLVQLGRLILALATHNINAYQTYQKSMEALRHYSPRLKECINWLVVPGPVVLRPISPTAPMPASPAKSIDKFLREIADHVVTVLDNTAHLTDTLTSVVARELENGRLVRLMTKLSMINERPDFFDQSQWSENGDRYYLKLFRDYVFHQVDSQGRPVTDLAHVISTLNKLDAGSEEKIALTSHDEQSVLVVSYRELKRGFESAWQELTKTNRRA